jgi:hypothetical protein
MDEFSSVITIVAVPGLLARTVVTHQDVKLAGFVSLGNGDVI